ncbi:hypothetical protein [Thermococcus sp. 5-4]|uniref:hypothetical protein n=1 Tax=Thermococcus sp. 5-4 TaxID=2008440 RepID=UPI000B4A41F3|nr:hypothetical protein [Thermococcus sp. 5-4]ASA76839.1 hypothetical protein CDI07_00510 [Thermococcus sp. 5-4]
MAMFLVTHRYSDEESIEATKEAADFFKRLPLTGDVEFLASYNFVGGSYTIWRAKDREALEEYMKTIDAPTFHKNMEITEIVQSYPPTVEYTVRLWEMLYHMSGG